MDLSQQNKTNEHLKDSNYSQFISWKTDPLLYDNEPITADTWLTANRLIELNRQKDIFYCEEQTLNLYPILVKKIDFIRKNSTDRILSRFPFLVLTQEEKNLIQSKILLISEFTRDYFYRSINDSTKSWRKRFQNYLERGAIPYPLFRCACEILQIPLVRKNMVSLSFESARGKRYTIPTELSKSLAYLCGVINGDGHLHSHWLRIIDETKVHIQFLSELFEQIFADSGEIFPTGNAWNVELRSSSAVRLINFLTQQTIEGAKYKSLQEPLIFKKLGEPYRNLYWRGAMDADGSFVHQISFSSASKRFVDDYRNFLATLQIKSKVTPMRNDAYLLSVPIDFKLQYAKEIGVLNSKKREDFISLISKRSIIFNGINDTAITQDGFFDLTILRPIYIKGFSSQLKWIRKGKPFTTIENELDLSQGQYYHYEQGTRAIPIELLFKLYNTSSSNKVMKELYKTRLNLTFQSSTSKPITLPMKSTQELIKIMSRLLPLSKWARIVQPTQETKDKIEHIFSVKINDNRVSGSLVLRFLQTFGHYIEIPIEEILDNSFRLD